jgi:hypothetical protein
MTKMSLLRVDRMLEVCFLWDKIKTPEVEFFWMDGVAITIV